MKIGGLQKTSLIDFPGTISAVVFACGCNFTCPYCHNPQLVRGALDQHTTLLDPSEVDSFLQKRRKVLDGVVISGGEPTLQGDALIAFCRRLKAQGYKIKLDTNGSKPDVLRELIKLRLPDYIAMDLKADPFYYPEAICSKELAGRIPESVEIISASVIAHEFRVTCVYPFITQDSFNEILKVADKSSKIFLQSVNLESVLKPSFFGESGQGRSLNGEELELLRIKASAAGFDCHIR